MDRVLALTRWMEGELLRRGLAPDRVCAVLPGIHRPGPPRDRAQARRLLGLGEGPIVLSVGRRIPRKGHDHLIRAFPAVLDAYPSAQLLIVGEGPYGPKLEAQVHRLGLTNRIAMAGFLSDEELETAWAADDLFVLPWFFLYR